MYTPLHPSLDTPQKQAWSSHRTEKCERNTVGEEPKWKIRELLLVAVNIASSSLVSLQALLWFPSRKEPGPPLSRSFPLMVSKIPESLSSYFAALDFPTPYSVFDHICIITFIIIIIIIYFFFASATQNLNFMANIASHQKR